MILREGFIARSIHIRRFTRTIVRLDRSYRVFTGARSLTHVFLAGLAFDFCVRYSAEDARRAGFSVLVIEDPCRSTSADRRKQRDPPSKTLPSNPSRPATSRNC
jgi:nicotinamidase/pyrazinamidase